MDTKQRLLIPVIRDDILCSDDDDDESSSSTLKVVIVDNPERSVKEAENAREQQKIKNREAAAKCRQKRKERENKLTEENNCLKSKNTILRYQVRKCRQDAEHLRNAISNHLATCSVRDVKLQQLVLVNDSMMCGDVDDDDEEEEPRKDRKIKTAVRIAARTDVSFPDNELVIDDEKQT